MKLLHTGSRIPIIGFAIVGTYIYIYLEFILTHILFRINRLNICITARFIHTFINTCRTLLSPRFISLTKHHPLYARLTINKTILSIRPYRNF